jgi:hypothetical protein
VIVGLGVDCAELKVVFGQESFDIDGIGGTFFCFFDFVLGIIFRLFMVFEEGIKIEDEGFKIL